MIDDRIHVFERARLGRAPFRLVGVTTRRGPLEVAPGVFVGAPGQPMGVCQYCGTSIAEICTIRDADGKTFEVGNVCVGKTGDAGLRKAVNAALRDKRAEQRRAASDRRAERTRERLTDPVLRASLAALPHPYAFRAEKGDTRLDWAEWMMQHAGMAGRADVARYIDYLSKGDK